MMTSKKKKRHELVENYLVLYKDIKEKEAQLKEMRPDIENLLTSGEIIEHEMGTISKTESVSYKVDNINLEKAIESGEMNEIEMAQYVETKYGLTKQGKDMFTRNSVLQLCVTREISDRLNVKIKAA